MFSSNVNMAEVTPEISFIESGFDSYQSIMVSGGQPQVNADRNIIFSEVVLCTQLLFLNLKSYLSLHM